MSVLALKVCLCYTTESIVWGSCQSVLAAARRHGGSCAPFALRHMPCAVMLFLTLLVYAVCCALLSSGASLSPQTSACTSPSACGATAAGSTLVVSWTTQSRPLTAFSKTCDASCVESQLPPTTRKRLDQHGCLPSAVLGPSRRRHHHQHQQA